MCKVAEHAWNMIIELRIELREAQKIRSQIIGIKIAFVAASLGFVVGGKSGPEYPLILVPAFASIFFDYLIITYHSLKKMGKSLILNFKELCDILSSYTILPLYCKKFDYHEALADTCEV